MVRRNTKMQEKRNVLVIRRLLSSKHKIRVHFSGDEVLLALWIFGLSLEGHSEAPTLNMHTENCSNRPARREKKKVFSLWYIMESLKYQIFWVKSFVGRSKLQYTYACVCVSYNRERIGIRTLLSAALRMFPYKNLYMRKLEN